MDRYSKRKQFHITPVAKEEFMAKTKGIYKRGNIWWIRYACADGQIKRESSHSRSFKTAQAILINRKNQVQEGNEPTPKTINNHTFGGLVERYLIWASRQRSFGSKKYFIQALANEFGLLPLGRFTTMAVEEFQSKTINAGKASATANRFLATLKHMFTKALDWEMVDEEAAKRVKKVKHLPENNRRLRYLSQDESQALVNACAPHLKPIVICALNTGMRKEEILSLEWERHVDLKHGFILLDITKNGERREIPINQTFRTTLKGLVRRLDCPYVFADSEGNRYKSVTKAFKSALKRAGIKDFTFHDCRHTFASFLVMSSVDITTIKELLGHKTLAMTLRYAHLAPGHKVKAVELLDGEPPLKPTAQLLHNLKNKGLTLAG